MVDSTWKAACPHYRVAGECLLCKDARIAELEAKSFGANRANKETGWTRDWPTEPGWWWVWGPGQTKATAALIDEDLDASVLGSLWHRESTDDGYWRWHRADQPPAPPEEPGEQSQAERCDAGHEYYEGACFHCGLPGPRDTATEPEGGKP